jgi:hypothetical protein
VILGGIRSLGSSAFRVAVFLFRSAWFCQCGYIFSAYAFHFSCFSLFFYRLFCRGLDLECGEVVSFVGI